MIVWTATFEKSVDDETKVMIKAKSGRWVVGHLTAPDGAFHA
jgi:small nuclear ribonucleoprotein (snRNP)-like protein